MSLTPGTRLGPYEVTALIGAGGMGEVYRARDTRLERDVAVKVLPDVWGADPERVSRFAREARTLAALNHPHIAHIHGLEETAGLTALVMELVEGPTLADRLAGGPLPLDDVLSIARQIAEALEAAHDQGIVHRDLKPANVKVRDDGTVKLLDFGLAKALADGTDAAAGAAPTLTVLSMSPTAASPVAMTAAGIILGTAPYMAPEQAKGRGVDRRADIWAFGCVLFEMLTGTRAFGGDDVSDTLAAVLRAEPEWNRLPAGTPAPVRRVLRRCLVKDPRSRLRDIGDARLELTEADETATSTEGATRKGRGRVPLWLVSACIGFAALAIALAIPAGRHLREVEVRPPAARFSVDLPGELSTAVQSPAISPDGRFIVYRGTTRDGFALLLYTLDAAATRVLPQTESAQGLMFWSPDSQSIAFASGGTLWQMRLDSGLRLPIARLPDERLPFLGGAWNAHGDILFALGNRILRIRTGEEPQPVPLATDSQDIDLSFPSYLPDGTHFLFRLRSNDPGRHGLWVASVTGEATRIAAVNATSPAHYRDGFVLYDRDGTALAQPFDARALAFTAAPQTLTTDRVTSISTSTNGRMVYREISVALRGQFTWFDRNGRMLGSVGEIDDYPTFDLSADGRLLVVTRSDGQSSNLWTINVETGAATRLTTGNVRDVDPRWSPDGRRIVFGSTRAAGRAPYAIAATGGPPTLLMPWNRAQFALDGWSPDGARLLFHDTTGGQAEMWSMPLSGDHVLTSVFRPLSRDVDQGQYSPDGRFIAFNTDDSGRQEVWVVPAAATGERWQVSNAGGVQPRWRPDGKELFYLSPDRELMAAPVAITDNGFSSGAPHALFKTNLRSLPTTEEYTVGPGGERFLLRVPEAGALTNRVTVITDWPSLIGHGR